MKTGTRGGYVSSRYRKLQNELSELIEQKGVVNFGRLQNWPVFGKSAGVTSL